MIWNVLPLQECRRMLQFESDNLSDDGKEFSSPLIMMAQTPIIVSIALVSCKKGKQVSEESYNPSKYCLNLKSLLKQQENISPPHTAAPMC